MHTVTDARTRLLAYCGAQEAREACLGPLGPACTGECDQYHCDDVCFQGVDSLSDAEWTIGLIPLIEVAAVRECKYCHGRGVATLEDGCTIPDLGCPHCRGGKVTDEHALLRMCLAVARECLPYYFSTSPTIHERYQREARIVLDACQTYLDDPSDETLDAWGKTLDNFGQAPPDWIPFPFASFMEHPKAPKSKSAYLAGKLSAAAKILGDRFRAAILKALSM